MWSRVLKEGQFVCLYFQLAAVCSVEWADLAVFKLKAANDIPVCFIFIYGVFNDTLNSTDCTAPNKEFG